MNFDEVELNYILEALHYFNAHRVPNIDPVNQAVYIAEVEGLMGKVGAYLDGEDSE